MELPESPREARSRHEDEAITTAVLKTQIIGFRELMTERMGNQDRVLADIKEQTTKTNGHVADAFKEIGNINDWKNKVVGALFISNIIIVPLLVWLITQHMQA